VAAEWRSSGFGAYGSGLLWTVVPDAPYLSPENWPALDGTGIEVLRTAFADVCLWQNGRFLWQSVYTGKATPMSSDAEILFEAGVTDKHFRKIVLFEPLFRRALKRLGPLSSEECFGFAPLPALGGAIAEEYLIKSRMREYVTIAANFLG
jgi:hypothetical protein